MNLDLLHEFDPSLDVVRGTRGEFATVGPLCRPDPGLLTWADDYRWLRRALEAGNVTAVFARSEDVEAAGGPGCRTVILSPEPLVDLVRFHNWLAGAGQYIRAGLHLWQRWQAESSRVDARAEIGAVGARWVDSSRYGRIMVRHVGGVRIYDHAHVGPFAVVVSGVWPGRPTVIGTDAYIGQLANIGHGCRIGAGAVVLPGAILCGSVVVEEGATVGPGAVVVNGIHIGANATVTAGAVVTRDVPPEAKVSGNWAVAHERQVAHTKALAGGSHHVQF